MKHPSPRIIIFQTIWLTLLLSFASICFAQTPTTVSIAFDTDQWNQNMLLTDLNKNAPRDTIRFVASSPDAPYTYLISYDNSIKPIQTYLGQSNTHASSVTCYDSAGHELFTFTREARMTEKGASNAAAKEIVKRLRTLALRTK